MIRVVHEELQKFRDETRRSDINLLSTNKEKSNIETYEYKTKPLQLVHSHLWEYNIPTSNLNDKKGYVVVTFIDDCSYIKGAYILKSTLRKIDILQYFKKFEAKATKQLKTKIHCLR